MDIRLEHIVTAIKALRAAETILTEDDYGARSRAVTECLIARARLEAAIGDVSIAVLEK